MLYSNHWMRVRDCPRNHTWNHNSLSDHHDTYNDVLIQRFEFCSPLGVILDHVFGTSSVGKLVSPFILISFPSLGWLDVLTQVYR